MISHRNGKCFSVAQSSIHYTLYVLAAAKTKLLFISCNINFRLAEVIFEWRGVGSQNSSVAIKKILSASGWIVKRLLTWVRLKSRFLSSRRWPFLDLFHPGRQDIYIRCKLDNNTSTIWNCNKARGPRTWVRLICQCWYTKFHWTRSGRSTGFSKHGASLRPPCVPCVPCVLCWSSVQYRFLTGNSGKLRLRSILQLLIGHVGKRVF